MQPTFNYQGKSDRMLKQILQKLYKNLSFGGKSIQGCILTEIFLSVEII